MVAEVVRLRKTSDPSSLGLHLPGIRRGGEGHQRKFSRQKIRLIQSLDLLVIDEISMVRADLLDAVDDVLRRYRDRHQPFGGAQLLITMPGSCRPLRTIRRLPQLS
jgi:hypothetical protein